MNRRDFLKNGMTVGVAGTVSTGIITSAAVANPDIILPKSLIVGRDVSIEETKLKLEEIFREEWDIRRGFNRLPIRSDVTHLLSTLKCEDFVTYIVYESMASRIYAGLPYNPDWYSTSLMEFQRLHTRISGF